MNPLPKEYITLCNSMSYIIFGFGMIVVNLKINTF